VGTVVVLCDKVSCSKVVALFGLLRGKECSGRHNRGLWPRSIDLGQRVTYSYRRRRRFRALGTPLVGDRVSHRGPFGNRTDF
jgi:hypothetical protein